MAQLLSWNSSIMSTRLALLRGLPCPKIAASGAGGGSLAAGEEEVYSAAYQV